MAVKHLKNSRLGIRGQAVIEMAMTLPFILWLIYYTFNAFYSVHTAHVAQRYAALGLYASLNNRAKFVVDDSGGQSRLIKREWMAVQYTDIDGTAPRRRIIFGPVQMTNTVGICREPGCSK